MLTAPPTRAWWTAMVGAGLLVVLTAAPAHAHDIRGGTDRSVWGYLPLGVEHMLLGWDHLLFIGGVILLARQWRRAAKMLSIFVIGHSTTLILATMTNWQVNAYVVDVVIALSVVFVAVVAFLEETIDWTMFGVIVFAFGLAHGVGLSTRLQELGLPEEGLLARVVAFNIGVEIGQLALVAAVALISAVVTRVLRRRDKGVGVAPKLQKLTVSVLLVGGMLAAGLAIYEGVTAPSEPVPAAVAADRSVQPVASTTPVLQCQVEERTHQLPGTGGHATANFFEPDQPPPLADFGHSMGDGYVVILYPPTIATPELDELRTLVSETEGLLAGPGIEYPDEYRVLGASEMLRCPTADITATREFVNAQFSN